MTEKDYKKLEMRVKDKSSPYLKLLKLQMAVDNTVLVRRYMDLKAGKYASKAHELWGDGTFVAKMCESPLGTDYDDFPTWYNAIASVYGKPIYGLDKHELEPEPVQVQVEEPEPVQEPVQEPTPVQEPEPEPAPVQEPEPVPEEFITKKETPLAYVNPDVTSLITCMLKYLSAYNNVPVNPQEEIARITGEKLPIYQAQYVQIYMLRNFSNDRKPEVLQYDRELTEALKKLGLRIKDYENIN